MRKEEIEPGLAKPCIICGFKGPFLFRWADERGHGDTSFDRMHIFCPECETGMGDRNGWADPTDLDREKLLHTWNVLNRGSKAPQEPVEKPRMFQVLDEMNLDDVTNGSRLVEVSGAFVEANMSNKGAIIGMGAPATAIFSIEQDLKIPILVLIDKKEYFKRKGNG